jgi:hypothetical protein
MIVCSKSSGGASRNGLWDRRVREASGRLWPLEGEKLSAAARRATGVVDFGDTGIESRLGLLAKSIETEADLHWFGRMLAWIHLRDILRTRLQLEETWQKCEGFETEPIERPVFITGMPRSGSTFLHEMLAQDPNHRSPLVWEVMSPLPTGAKGRIWRTAANLWWFRQMAPEADSVHPIRATTPHECVAIHSYTLLSRAFAAIFRVPSYEAYLNSVELDPAYAWQKRFLQYLQWRGPRRRWILKAPDHVFHLEALLRIFPDAVIIQTHRDPLEVLQSSSRLTRVLQGVFAHPEPHRETGIREARLLADGMDRITRFRETHPELADRFLDVNYEEVVSNPVGTLRRVYWQLGLPLADAALTRIQHLAGKRARYGGCRRETTLADLGLDSEAEGRRFADYCARFGVRPVLKRGG